MFELEVRDWDEGNDERGECIVLRIEDGVEEH
jgi:hypothetical protein